jgi:hypothetical protein
MYAMFCRRPVVPSAQTSRLSRKFLATALLLLSELLLVASLAPKLSLGCFRPGEELKGQGDAGHQTRLLQAGEARHSLGYALVAIGHSGGGEAQTRKGDIEV